MDIVKKLFFAPFFLFSLVVLLIFADQLMADPLGVLFGFGADSAFTMIYLIAALLMTGFFYILFSTLSNDWRIVLPVGIMAALIPVGLFPDLMIAFYVSIGILIGAVISFLVQQQKMASYVNFSATQLLQPQIKLFNLFLILSLSLGFYFSASALIKEKGFSVPDQFIEAAVAMSGQQGELNSLNENTQPKKPLITPELAAQLKQNPELLAQYGYSIADVEAMSGTGENPEAGTAQLIKKKVNEAVAPYTDWIAPLLSVLFFVSLSSLSSFFSLLLPPLIGLVFMILEKTNFVHFEKEMREVKKLIV